MLIPIEQSDAGLGVKIESTDEKLAKSSYMILLNSSTFIKLLGNRKFLLLDESELYHRSGNRIAAREQMFGGIFAYSTERAELHIVTRLMQIIVIKIKYSFGNSGLSDISVIL